ncbi:hypothetical protein [Paludibaculum fermentans]|uniref:hypothetical protein n=1 Tax=Paludibaculum fermentans TaxID=1473598 RepID=UPI003EBA2B00
MKPLSAGTTPYQKRAATTLGGPELPWMTSVERAVRQCGGAARAWRRLLRMARLDLPLVHRPMARIRRLVRVWDQDAAGLRLPWF